MYSIAAFEHPRLAQALADYLTIQQIKCKVIEQDNQYLLLIEDYQDMDKARPIVEDFISNPNQQKYLQASWQRNDVNQLSVKGTGIATIFQTIWQQTAWLSRSIALAVIAVYILSITGSAVWLFQTLSFPAEISQLAGLEIYRLLTPALMHASFIHLAFNLCWWVYLAGRIEKTEDSTRLINLVLFAAISSHLLQYALEGNLFLGLSGVVYGLFGYVWLMAKRSGEPAYQLSNAMFGLIVGWMLFGFADLLPIRMANWAHLGGLLAGLALAVISKPKQNQNK